MSMKLVLYRLLFTALWSLGIYCCCRSCVMHIRWQLFTDRTFVQDRRGNVTHLQSSIHSFISVFLWERFHLAADHTGIVTGCWKTTSCSYSYLCCFFLLSFLLAWSYFSMQLSCYDVNHPSKAFLCFVKYNHMSPNYICRRWLFRAFECISFLLQCDEYQKGNIFGQQDFWYLRIWLVNKK